MATIDDVIAWANTLPAWQGDAVRRLLVAGEQPLSPQDYSEILALAKVDLRLTSRPGNVTPVPPTAGQFSGASSHKTSGMVTVTKEGDRYIVNLGGDFSFDGAPDPYVALGAGKKPLPGGLIAVLDSNTGAQRYAIDAEGLDGAKQVIIWCKRYAVPLGVAKIE